MDLDRFLEGKPELKKILALYGENTLSEYIQMTASAVKGIDFSYFEGRFPEFSKTYLSVLSPILGKDVASRSLSTLQVNRLVSTTDHQGIITHPFFLSTTYARSLYALDNTESSVVTFPCAGISLSNSSFPRGIAYHDQEDTLQKIYLKSLGSKVPLCGISPMEEDEKQKIIDSLFLAPLETTKKKKLLSFMKDTLLSEDFFKQSDYDSQCTLGSHSLWKEIVPFSGIDLVYLSQEKLASALVIDHHLSQKTIIHELLFTTQGHNLFLEYFNGTQGAFSGTDRGTHLFWGIHNGERAQLFIKEGRLESADQTLVVSLLPDDIKKALENKEIYPSMALCFILISFYYGFVCGGGFSQVNYLKDMKEAWMRIIRDMVQAGEALAVEKIPTNVFLGELVVFERNTTENDPLYSLDLVLEQEEGSLHKENCSHKKMKESFIRMCACFAGTMESVSQS